MVRVSEVNGTGKCAKRYGGNAKRYGSGVIWFFTDVADRLYTAIDSRNAGSREKKGANIMRRNNRQKSSNMLDHYDRVYIEIPQCPWLHSMVCEPLKTIYYNRASDPWANIDRMFRSVYDLESFVFRYRIDLG